MPAARSVSISLRTGFRNSRRRAHFAINSTASAGCGSACQVWKKMLSSRLLVNAIQSPRGDQEGKVSKSEPVSSFRAAPVATLRMYRLRLSPVARRNTTSFPLGDQLGMPAFVLSVVSGLKPPPSTPTVISRAVWICAR